MPAFLSLADGVLLGHEKLDVYRFSIGYAAWVGQQIEIEIGIAIGIDT